MEEGIGDAFQNETKYSPESRGSRLDMSRKPKGYKEYPGAEGIVLPPPDAVAERAVGLAECLRARNSIREFSAVPLDKGLLSFLLWAAGGIRGKGRGHFEFRTAPSAGALYPIETYLVVNRVEGIPNGVYHYSVKTHSLEVLRLGDFGPVVALAALRQEMCQEAAVVFVWTAVFNRTKWKYGQRAYRYVYLDAGHIAQNLALAATSIRLGSCQIGALLDEEMNAIIGVDGADESVIYMSAVGVPL